MDRHETTFGLSRRTVLRLGAGLGASGLMSGALINQPVAHAQSTPTDATPVAGEDVVVIVGDVVDFTLEPEDRWPAPVGSVTLRMHAGFFDGQDAWFIRTDASDQTFAEEQGLVHVPLLANALKAEDSYANIYLFADGAEDQRPVVSTIPGQDNFTSAFRVHNVTVSDESELLDSVEMIQAAEQDGRVTIEQTDIIVNYPLVVWDGGGLPVDDGMAEPLGAGPLIETPDTANGTVTFKLHQCYPGSRYIATDTSSEPMAPMMGLPPSVPTQQLAEVGATAPIYVFSNGLPGTGAMGFQPAVFNAKAGDPMWSPFWDHITVMWTDENQAELLTSEAEINERAEAGDVELYNGVPDSHPDGFVVNCPAPILAPTTYDPEQFARAHRMRTM